MERWKARLLVQGFRATPAALAVVRDLAGPEVTAHEYATTGGLTLRLGGGVAVNAPFDEWFCDEASAVLDVDGDALFVSAPGEDALRVSYQPHLPAYLDAVDSRGRAITDCCFSHGDRVRLSPIGGCAYRCDYCNLPAERYVRRDLEQLGEALEFAMHDANLPPRHVLVSGGSPGPRHVEWFIEMILEIVALSPLPVDVMMSAVANARDTVARLLDGGVTGFAINLELFGEDASELYIRGKHRKARPSFDAFVTAAVDGLGREGAVRSLVVAGLEPADVTLAGIDHLAALGADPVLSPFRPAERTSLAERRPPDLNEMLDLLDGARKIVEAREVRLGPNCIDCQHNTLTFPWDVRAR